MADWFPFGAEACLRYEFLNRQPLLPHDELLCKEATIIDCMVKNTLEDSSHKQQACVMTAFVALLQSHCQVKSALEQGGAKTSTCTLSDVLCGLCKHKCYVAYTCCKCSPEPTCFNHGDFFGSCSCKGDRMIFLRDDFANLQLVAQKYEREEEIRKLTQKLCVYDKGDGAPSRGVSELIESLLLTNAASSREACEKEEDREDAWSGNMLFNSEIFAAIPLSDYTQAQEEEEEEEEEASDTEVLRIKRRRVASPQSKWFQVDEQEIAQVKFSARSLEYEISSPTMGCEGSSKQEHALSDIQAHTKDASALKGDQISTCQVIGEPTSKGSAAEVMSQLKSDQETILEEVVAGQARVLSSNSHDKRENSKEERTTPCMITNVTPPQLRATTEYLLPIGELHSDLDKKHSAESKSKADLGALSLILTGSTMVNEIQEVQAVKGDGVSVNGAEALQVEGAADTLHLDVVCDPELTRVDGGHFKEEECFSSEAASMEPRSSVLLTDLVAESPLAVMVERDDSSASAETCKPVTSLLDNVDMGYREWPGKALPDGGRLCCAEVVSNLCDKSSQALGTRNILHDALVDVEMIKEGINAMSSNECNKLEATTSSSPEPKRGLIIHLNRKVEQPQKKAASLFHDQNKCKDEYEEVDIFDGQAGGDAWCLGEEVGFCSVVSNSGESNCPLQYLTSTSGDDFPQHRLEHGDSSGSFDIKFESFLGETGQRHGKSAALHVGGNFPLGLEPSSQRMPAKDDRWGASESINDLSCREDVLPAACSKQQQVELSCDLPNEVLEKLLAGVRTSVGRDAQLYDIGLDVHAPRFSRSSHPRREAFGNNVVEQHLYKSQTHGGVKTNPYIDQRTHWGGRPQGCYDCSSHHSTSQTASRKNSDKYKHMRRSLPSLHQGHHPYHRETHRYRPVFQEERVPCGYSKRRPNRGFYCGWKDAKSNNTLGGERGPGPIERVVDREVAGCSSSTSAGSYVEGYDPLKWEISPNRYYGQFSQSYPHVPSLRVSRDS